MENHTCQTAARALRRGECTPLDLVEQCLARIDRFEPRVKAWVRDDADDARKTALRLDEELHAGRDRGPLHGVPIGIKDIVDVAGWPTEAGASWRRHEIAPCDARLVARLREAGAIILGKTVTTEFGCFDPPPTRNPWSLSRTPGGSSSGSAAAVALGMCLAAIGTQTGGSITRPASFCGVAGCKPSWGTVSTQGVVPVSHHLDHPGPIARCVADLSDVLHVLVEPDAALEVRGPAARVEPPRLGIVAEFFLSEASEEVRAATLHAAEQWRAAGARIEPFTLPENVAEVLTMHRRIMAFEAAQFHRAALAEHRAEYGQHVRTLLDEGLALSTSDYADARNHQVRFQERLQAHWGAVDALLTPATVTTAPGLETTGDPRFNAPWSYAGVPTVSWPVAVAADGLPVAVQLIGPRGADFRLLEVAAWCERQTGWNAQPPMLEELNQKD